MSTTYEKYGYTVRKRGDLWVVYFGNTWVSNHSSQTSAKEMIETLLRVW